jgi:hypothetical protein
MTRTIEGPPIAGRAHRRRTRRTVNDTTGPWSDPLALAVHSAPRSRTMSRPLLDLAAQISRIFVLGMTTAAFVLVPILLVLALVD